VNDTELNDIIIKKSQDVCNWRYLMGRPICGCGWSAIEDWPDGGGYSDHTPYLIFLMHVKDKHKLDIKPHEGLILP